MSRFLNGKISNAGPFTACQSPNCCKKHREPIFDRKNIELKRNKVNKDYLKSQNSVHINHTFCTNVKKSISILEGRH